MTRPQQIPIDDLEELYAAFLLKTFRKVSKAVCESGLDQRQIADRISMDPAQLCKSLSGRHNVTMKTLFKIARAVDHRLDVDLTNLELLRSASVLPATAQTTDFSDQFIRSPASAGAFPPSTPAFTQLTEGGSANDTPLLAVAA
ncbi:MAG TPA: helix-turn-helix transcriptional regulator [Allosphingosinicella sp.]|jgi:transcriptional regulator with XRE-family HTH domain